MEKKFALLFSLALTLLVALNFYFFSNHSEKQPVLIERVIDGDTLVASSGETLRLVNINTPEKNDHGYEEAKNYLAKLENKSVEVEILGLDKYQRKLARIFAPDYINLEIIQRGLGKKFLVYENELKLFRDAEESAIKNSLGIWEHSEDYGCFTSEINENNEIIVIKNNCSEKLVNGWIIADESRKKYKFPEVSLGAINLHTSEGEDNSSDIYWNQNQNVWNNDRDTLYLFDAEEKIVHFNSYGYIFLPFSTIFCLGV